VEGCVVIVVEGVAPKAGRGEAGATVLGSVGGTVAAFGGIDGTVA
jgi:hypothetical protein